MTRLVEASAERPVLFLFEDARQAAEELLNRIPDFKIEFWTKRQYYNDPERLRRDVEALRSAGLK